MSDAFGNEAVVFNTAIEGFVRTYEDRLTPAIRSELAHNGIDLQRLHPAYSLEVFEKAMRRAGEALYPDMEEGERWHLMGREFVTGYLQTALGRAVMPLARVLGPRRALERIARTFRTGSNYVGAEAKTLGPCEVELRTWMMEPFVEAWRGRPTLQLDYRRGILEELMQRLGARGARVEVVEKDLHTQTARFRITWEG